MTRQELWRRYTAKNPHWLTDGANLTADGLKRLFDQTFEVGFREGASSQPPPSMFDGFFDLNRHRSR